MAQITRAIRAEYSLAADLIPAAILKSIDQAELFDRLSYSRELTRKSQAATDPVARKGYAHLARAVMLARPRAETQRQHAEQIAKAAGLPAGSRQADAIRRDAADLLDRDPVAPRRADSVNIAKAKAATSAPDRMQVVYDPSGQPIGLCDPAAIQPVEVKTAHEVTRDLETADTAATVGKARAPRRTPGRH